MSRGKRVKARSRALDELRAAALLDEESAHRKADDALCALLEAYGEDDVVALHRMMRDRWWFA